jgi:hypothetical protein
MQASGYLELEPHTETQARAAERAKVAAEEAAEKEAVRSAAAEVERLAAEAAAAEQAKKVWCSVFDRLCCV